MKFLNVLAIILIFFTASSHAGVIGTAEVNGVAYDYNTVVGSYVEHKDLLAAQPWLNGLGSIIDFINAGLSNIPDYVSVLNSDNLIAGVDFSPLFYISDFGADQITAFDYRYDALRIDVANFDTDLIIEWAVLTVAESGGAVPSPAPLALIALSLVGFRLLQRRKA